MALMTSSMAQAKSVITNPMVIQDIEAGKVTVTITGNEGWEKLEDVPTLYFEQPASDAIGSFSADLISQFDGGAIGLSIEYDGTAADTDFAAELAFKSADVFTASTDGASLMKDNEEIAKLDGTGVLTLSDGIANLLGEDIVLPIKVIVKYRETTPVKEEKTTNGVFNVVLTPAEIAIPETVPASVSAVGAAGFSSPYALDFTSLKEKGLTANIGIGFDDNSIKLVAVTKVPANTAIYLKGDADDYVIPTLAEDESYYVNMFKPAIEKTDVPTTVTVGGETFKNYTFNRSKTTGEPTFYPIEGSASVGPNRMYLSMPDWADPGKTSTSTGTVDKKIGDLKVASFSSDKDLDFTDVKGLKAFVAVGFSDNSIVLSEVKKVAAGTGLYLKADAAGTYTIPAATGTVPYYVNAFVGLPSGGTISKTATIDGVEFTNLTFSANKAGTAASFYPLTEDKTYSAGAMYLQLPAAIVSKASSRGIGVVFAEDATITGINEIAQSVKAEKNEGIFNLNGQRVSTAKKGLYIVNGKKMLMK